MDVRRLAGVFLLSFVACREAELVSVEVPQDLTPPGCLGHGGDVEPRSSCATVVTDRAVDVLFVVDAHASAFGWQVALADAMPRFVQAALGGRPVPDLRVAIVPAQRIDGMCEGTPAGRSPGVFSDRSCLDRSSWFEGQAAREACVARCSKSYDHEGLWWSWSSGDDVDALGEQLRCAALVSDRGCSAAEPLAAVRAVYGRNPEDGVFFRPGAAPFLVIVSAADDCSAELGAGAALDTLGRGECWIEGADCVEVGDSVWSCEQADSARLLDPSEGSAWIAEQFRWSRLLATPSGHVSILAGWGSGSSVPLRVRPPGPQHEFVAPTCSRGEAEALPPIRLTGVADRLELAGVDVSTGSLCRNGLEQTLEALGRRVVEALHPGCVPYCVADEDANTPGVQHDCTFVGHWVDDAGRHERQLPLCEATGGGDGISPGAPGCVVLRTGPAMHPTCVEQGSNVEAELVWNGPLPLGLALVPHCRVSKNRSLDCPDLP